MLMQGLIRPEQGMTVLTGLNRRFSSILADTIENLNQTRTCFSQDETEHVHVAGWCLHAVPMCADVE